MSFETRILARIGPDALERAIEAAFPPATSGVDRDFAEFRSLTARILFERYGAPLPPRLIPALRAGARRAVACEDMAEFIAEAFDLAPIAGRAA